MARKLEYIIKKEHDERLLLHYLKGHLQLSSRLIKKLKLVPEGLQINGNHARTIDIIREGDRLNINMPEEALLFEPLPVDLDILYEDEDIFIANKPSGMVMHPSRHHQGSTLANAFCAYFATKNKCYAFRPIGRLDRGTSGLVVCALNKYAASRLSGRIKKTYLALASGFYEGSGTIDSPIIRPDPMRILRWVGEEGEKAVTHWRALKSGRDMSLLEIQLETGRTHQIRVHFASLGTPLLGDDMYGGDAGLIGRQALHCGGLELFHPVSNEKLCFWADLPEDMRKLAEDKTGDLFK